MHRARNVTVNGAISYTVPIECIADTVQAWQNLITDEELGAGQRSVSFKLDSPRARHSIDPNRGNAI